MCVRVCVPVEFMHVRHGSLGCVDIWKLLQVEILLS